ncbi:MAG: PAAR-like domain-containing protein, partial [Thiolinea sp.]
MANEVFANAREISCKSGDGKSICEFPDVCMTPPVTGLNPSGVPIPYPNTAFSKDTTNGTRTVKIDKKEVMQ